MIIRHLQYLMIPTMNLQFLLYINTSPALLQLWHFLFISYESNMIDQIVKWTKIKLCDFQHNPSQKLRSLPRWSLSYLIPQIPAIRCLLLKWLQILFQDGNKIYHKTGVCWLRCCKPCLVTWLDRCVRIELYV